MYATLYERTNTRDQDRQVAPSMYVVLFALAFPLQWELSLYQQKLAFDAVWWERVKIGL